MKGAILNSQGAFLAGFPKYAWHIHQLTRLGALRRPTVSAIMIVRRAVRRY